MLLLAFIPGDVTMPVEELRQASRRALENLIDLALNEPVDFILMAGDLFDGMGVRRIRDCLRLPRAGLAKRFGQQLVLELDRAQGHLSDPQEPFVPPLGFEQRLLLPAEVLGLPVEVEKGLGEHKREHAPYLNSQSEFQATIHRLLTQPDQLIYGEETGSETCARFQAAIHRILENHADKTN